MSGWWNTNTYTNGYSDGHGYSYINAETDAYAEVCANTEAAAHTSAKTVESFAKANIVASATGVERSVLTDFARLRVNARHRAAQSSYDAWSRRVGSLRKSAKIVLTVSCGSEYKRAPPLQLPKNNQIGKSTLIRL